MKKTGGRYVFGGLIGCMALAFLAPGLLNPLLESFLRVEKDLERADALVVMAGSTHDRLPAVARLYKEGRAPLILLTNDGVRGAWSAARQRNLDHVEWAEIELIREGIPGEAIERLPFSVSGSIYDALHAMAFARRKGLRSLLVVTSDYHSRRTLWSFRLAVGDEPFALGVHPVTSEGRSETGFGRLRVLTREVLKSICYGLMYDPEWIEKRGGMKGIALNGDNGALW